MIQAYANRNGRLEALSDPERQLRESVWIDLSAPTREEEELIAQEIGLTIPTRAEMEEIEISSRLYYEDGAAVMTTTLPANVDSAQRSLGPVTFVLADDRLVTVRYHEPRAFRTFPRRAARVSLGCSNGLQVLIALLEAVVDRLADILERAGRQIDALSQRVFKQQGKSSAKNKNFQTVLELIGQSGDLASDIRESLLSLDRLIGFLTQMTTQNKNSKDIRSRVKTLSRDTRSLIDHAGFLSQKITFLLDATLGMINIEQNAIIKIFSVAAVAFLPPTLIASIYGMNFEVMPELSWAYGYPLALALMVVSAVVPLWYFRRRGWL